MATREGAFRALVLWVVLVLGAAPGCDDGKGGAGDGDGGTDAGADADADGDGDADGDTDGDSDGDADHMVPTDFCNADGWCWENPTPHGDTYRAAWIAGPDDVWFTTDGGRVLRRSAGSWTTWRSPQPYETFRALWGLSSSEVYAVGTYGLARYDGDTWATISNQTGLTDITGFATDDLWVSGYGAVLHWNGTTWEQHAFGSSYLQAIWGSSPSDIWVAGQSGAVSHWNGVSWEDHAQASGATYMDIWGSAPNDVYFASASTSTILHWNGAAFEEIEPGLSSYWSAITGTAADDVWALGSSGVVAHYEGGFWTDVTPDASTWWMTAIAAAPGAQPWVVGMYGMMCERGSGDWACSDSITYEAPLSLWGGSAGSMVAMGASGPIAVRDSDGWSAATPTAGDYMLGVWQTGADEAWGYQADYFDDPPLTLYRWDGAAWTSTPVEAPSGINDVWVDHEGEAWAVGTGGAACRFDGASWACGNAGTSSDLYAVFGFSDSDVWAVGASGVTAHWDGDAWTAGTTGSSEALVALWGAAANDLWAAGDWGGGTIYHYTGTWEALTVPGATQVLDIYGFGTGDVWAVGYSGAIAHWTGTAWEDVESNVYEQLNSVWGADKDDVWAVGDSGTVVHWTGSGWAEDTSVTDWYTQAVGGTAADDMWIVCEYGTMYRNTGSGWSSVTNSLTENAIGLHDVFGTAEGALWVVDTTGRMHSRDGERWTRHGLQTDEDAVVTDVAAAGADDVWATLQEGVLLHWDGASWRLFPAPGATRLDALGARGPDQVWAAGDVLVSYDAAGFKRLADLSSVAAESSVVGVYGDADMAVAMLLDTGALYLWNGVALDAQLSGSGMAVYQDAQFLGVDDMWAVGTSGAILHWDGTTATAPQSLTANALTTVFATPDGHVFAGGGAGTLLHRTPE
jgi:hypothetical protein